MTTSVEVQAYIHQQKPLWNTLAIAYTLTAYVGGLALILLPVGWLHPIGVLLLTHSLVCSAYLSHELMHSTLFAGRYWNAVWGNVMLWLNGGCYARFQDLALLHIAHHVDRVDFSGFDLNAAVQQMPPGCRRLLLGLERCYFPIISFWLQWRSMLAPWRNPQRRDERWRTTGIALIRAALFMLLTIASPRALLLYFLAYIGMITILRWQDAFQHTYEVFPVGTPLPRRDRTHEQSNTFSTLISYRHGWLNLLLLNFGYHNAHHEVMKCPWHSLPQLDRDLFTGTETHYVPLTQLLQNYHRFRITRILSDQGNARDAAGNLTPETFYGAVGVSFLVLV